MRTFCNPCSGICSYSGKDSINHQVNYFINKIMYLCYRGYGRGGAEFAIGKHYVDGHNYGAVRARK